MDRQFVCQYYDLNSVIPFDLGEDESRGSNHRNATEKGHGTAFVTAARVGVLTQIGYRGLHIMEESSQLERLDMIVY